MGSSPSWSVVQTEVERLTNGQIKVRAAQGSPLGVGGGSRSNTLLGAMRFSQGSGTGFCMEKSRLHRLQLFFLCQEGPGYVLSNVLTSQMVTAA